MILNTLTILPEQEKDARAKAFYLLKKWTSVTFLDRAVRLYLDFLSAYAKQLDTPSPNQMDLEHRYVKSFLWRAGQMEDGLDLLARGQDKRAAYRGLLTGGEFSDYLFGRGASEWMIEDDPFFQRLGARVVRFDRPVIAEDYVLGALITHLSLEALKCTCNFDFTYRLAGKNEKGGSRIFRHWTYESLFQDPPKPGWPDWPPGRSYPSELPSCPPQNKAAGGEVHSDQEIPVEGIWEPWFPEGQVGCPNYFLRGSVAHKYLLEGTNEEHVVRWRLLWEDKRYQDGSIPVEEEAYFPKPAAPPRLRALPGETCPRAGYWQSPAVKDLVYVNIGDPMPGPRHTSWGMVIWHYAEPQPDN
ncbi:Imm72 family immunity protein [Burkholderia gladioli]|uniref:Imm72 family immunity protein n=1 Tax=Burkholderia gladioli TaxID=28095 RepID=UPI00163E7779|nr:Imm72 family immunity protein [Burkholderia gladioli]MDA0570973.1 Imm72 family immunity protein [Burkholderia gladioli]MDA0598959.1 Imm72 family immunity protein [Burkholderia gladioli]